MATFKGPNELGLFLVFVCGVAIFFMFRPKGSRLAALAAGAVLLLAVLSINFTGSRGALSGILALIGVFILLQRFPFKWFVISAGAAALLIFLTSPGNLGAQWRGGLNWQMITQETRVQWLQMSVDMMTDYPIAGIGLGQFEPRYFEYKIPGTQKLSEPPHNIVSQIMAENGLLGVALLAFMVFVIIRESQRLRLRPLEEDDEILGSVLLSIFAGMMAFAMTSNVLLDETYWTFLALVAISSSLYAARREAAVPPPEVGREVVVVLPRGGPGA